ncbi:unnamed protein product [Protopolystoma xenopodis]|uniref:Uncharacterized protein n=1 Tax=Protopolystoma xenopodis TaxID=117903 RepID=A0A448XIA7_9PLAT|nr:unnamed protein product [Protopolystoma xenopodis]
MPLGGATRGGQEGPVFSGLVSGVPQTSSLSRLLSIQSVALSPHPQAGPAQPRPAWSGPACWYDVHPVRSHFRRVRATPEASAPPPSPRCPGLSHEGFGLT